MSAPACNFINDCEKVSFVSQKQLDDNWSFVCDLLKSSCDVKVCVNTLIKRHLLNFIALNVWIATYIDFCNLFIALCMNTGLSNGIRIH